MEHGVVGAAVLALVAALVWVVKRVVPAFIHQNKQLIEGGLEHMQANTKAVETVTSTLKQMIAVQDERDKALFKQLDRIERT